MIRETIQRAAQAGVWGGLLGIAGAAMGAFLGFTRGGAQRGLPAAAGELDEETDREDERDGLVQQVRFLGLCRQVMEAAQPQLADAEYRARRRLEELGYYPCPKCGVAHLDGGKADCLPRGAYWHEDLRRFVEPEHPDWSAEGYEAATGQPWRGRDDGGGEDDGGAEGVH